MGQDKKVRAGKLRFVVMVSIGVAETREDLSRDLIEKIWAEVGGI
jgi:3-dehydroquinate synthetase